jgi:hypothetical protein
MSALSPRHLEGMTVKRYVLAATLSLLFGSAAQAAAIDLDTSHVIRAHRLADVSAVARTEVITPSPSMSELPEPEVFAMMLVGLILIGYRASRDSSEKFEK